MAHNHYTLMRGSVYRTTSCRVLLVLRDVEIPIGLCLATVHRDENLLLLSADGSHSLSPRSSSSGLHTVHEQLQLAGDNVLVRGDLLLDASRILLADSLHGFLMGRSGDRIFTEASVHETSKRPMRKRKLMNVHCFLNTERRRGIRPASVRRHR